MTRLFRGLVAGIVGGIVMNIWNFISYYLLNLANLRFLDWGAIFIFGEKPANLIETIMGLMTHVLWTGFLGVIIAFLIPLITSRGHLLSGAFLGFVFGFLIYAVPVLFRVPLLTYTTMGTAISNMVGGILWGIATAMMLRFLDTTPRVNS